MREWDSLSATQRLDIFWLGDNSNERDGAYLEKNWEATVDLRRERRQLDEQVAREDRSNACRAHRHDGTAAARWRRSLRVAGARSRSARRFAEELAGAGPGGGGGERATQLASEGRGAQIDAMPLEPDGEGSCRRLRGHGRRPATGSLAIASRRCPSPPGDGNAAAAAATHTSIAAALYAARRAPAARPVPAVARATEAEELEEKLMARARWRRR